MPIGAIAGIAGGLISSIAGLFKKGGSGGGSSGGNNSWLTNLLFPGMMAAGAIKSGIAKKKANAMNVPLVDYNQQMMLNQMKQKQASLESGAAYLPQQEAIKQQGLSAQNAVLRSTGGDVGATVEALSRINRSTGRNMNELYGNMSMEGLQMTGVMNQLVQQMADRSLTIQTQAKQQALADAIKQKQQYQQGLVTSLAGMDTGRFNPIQKSPIVPTGGVPQSAMTVSPATLANGMGDVTAGQQWGGYVPKKKSFDTTGILPDLNI